MYTTSRKITIIFFFLVHTQLLISKGFVSHYILYPLIFLYSLIFNPLHSVINGEQHKNHLYNQSGHYRKYRTFDC